MKVLVTLEMVSNLKNSDGLTLKRWESVTYKTGYQVADVGYTCTTPEECYELCKKFDGTCGIWFENGIYYVDHSFWVKTLKEALEIGRRYNQLTVLRWSNMSLIEC